MENRELTPTYREGKWFLLDADGNAISDGYQYIAEWGEGYFKVEQGVRKNIMRPDGSLVLQEWFHDVFKVENGFFIFGNTIRKTKDTPTRYIRGVAHVSGDIVFPMIFDRINDIKDSSAMYAEIGTKPYVLTPFCTIYDPEGSHLPQKIEIDEKSFFENLANWVLPGLQFYYRDTNARIDAAQVYRVGDTIRAGFFVDATTKLLKPAHRTRFLIASAHAARFFEDKDMVEHLPNAAKWNLTTFHFNSFFKVMDVYETPLCTQVLLLHIPETAAMLLRDSMTEFNFVNDFAGNGKSLVDLARQSLDEKLKMEFHDRSFDEEFCNRMEQPIGMSDDLTPLPLAPIPEPEEGEAATISRIIHLMSNDADIDFKAETKDNFQWNGPEGTVCEGCMYAKGINEKCDGCGRLFKKTFRENVIKGRCEYHKIALGVPSEFEERKKREAERKKDQEEKQSDTFAMKTLKDFISEKLDGNIDNLRTFDLSTLAEEPKYGEHDLSRANIVKSIMSLVFGGDWPELTVDSINHYEYRCDFINMFQQLLGSNICDQYFLGLRKFNPSSELQEKAVRLAHLEHSIGNFFVLPNKFNDKESLCNYRNNSKFRCYMDKYLAAVYAVMTDQKKQDLHMKGILYKNRKMMVDYQGYDGFVKFIHAMMLEPYVDESFCPKPIFKGYWSYMKDLGRDDYLKAVEEYITFVEDFITKRADKIIARLKILLTE